MGLAEAGADIAIWGTNPTKNEPAAAAWQATGRKVHLERCDVSDEAAVERPSPPRSRRWAGSTACSPTPAPAGSRPGIWELTTEEWRRVMGINLDGAFFTVRAGARHMVERGGGGRHRADARRRPRSTAPRTSRTTRRRKTALLGLTRAMAVGLARHGVRVNAISPGWTDTDLTAAGKPNEKFVHEHHDPHAGAALGRPGRVRRRRRLPGRPVAHVPHRRHARGRRRLHDLLSRSL